ncbi:MAG TPA: dihydrofolate reductase family protein [Vicinamibacterales bacterium]|nr:dihydrofolate reductase family protein [Vicinamibacterales bacterium]
MNNESSLDAINRLVTIEDHSASFPVQPIGNAWSRHYFDGPFYVHELPPKLPAISLVFVQTRDGNTGAEKPSELGGGPTDKHLIYEGLSRVAADAVLAGAGTVGHNVLFSISQPGMLDLRAELGLPRHLVQMVLSAAGHIDLSARIFSTPDVRVLLLAGEGCERAVSGQLRSRPWITLIPIRDSVALALECARREHGIHRISAIGGRHAATSLIDAGLVQDLYLTTSGNDGGEDGTPWYVGTRRPRLETVVRKREVTVRSPLLFEHLMIR